MLLSNKKEWFCNWFDTKYYHILYNNRNDDEAAFFIDNLITHFSLKQGSSILDMPCGKGRHSIYLNKKGFNVTGVDLSKQSIECAKKLENNTLNFYVHDMRKLFKKKCFDAVLNLFTSIGYFKNDDENNSAVKSMSDALKKDGLIIIDFMNSIKAASELISEEVKKIEEIEFKIERSIHNNVFLKKISFTEANKNYSYNEMVNALTLDDFKRYFSNNNLNIEAVFGNYKLEPFDVIKSDRLIVVGRKI